MCGSEPVTPASTVAITAAGWSDRRSPSAAPVGAASTSANVSRSSTARKPGAVYSIRPFTAMRWVLPSIRASITPSPRSM